MRYGTAALFVLLVLNSWIPHKELVVEPFEQLDSTFLGFEVSTVALGRSDSAGVLVAVREYQCSEWVSNTSGLSSPLTGWVSLSVSEDRSTSRSSSMK